MTAEPKRLDPREDRAWRAFKHAHHQLDVACSGTCCRTPG
jgi:hypothetical protein